MSQQYQVTLTQVVHQTATILVEANSEFEAMKLAEAKVDEYPLSVDWEDEFSSNTEAIDATKLESEAA
jgi:hypothetical protein